MAKFRSWNNHENKFFYWKDGIYFNDKECLDYIDTPVLRFNWQNAEECYYENLHIPETIYKNDIGVIEYEIEPYHDEKGYHNVKQIKGVVGLDLFKGLYVEKDNKKYYVNDYEDSFFISIGNIYEGDK